ncbi:MAG: hypothetical protein C0594_01655 [Marinilabiliales bacterium]|nr:MAG: hypothetical protein C0594_01655 [Marinilabiliales bacterium]
MVVWFGSGCLKPFIEPRYQVVNEEVILRVGLVYFPGCKGSGGKSTGKGKSSSRGGGTVKWKGSKRKIPCPAYS